MVLYNDDGLNDISDTILADTLVSDTNGFINFWVRSIATQGERHNTLMPALTILC